MYLHSILFYLTWPALIALAYWLIHLANKNFGDRWTEEENK